MGRSSRHRNFKLAAIIKTDHNLRDISTRRSSTNFSNQTESLTCIGHHDRCIKPRIRNSTRSHRSVLDSLLHDSSVFYVRFAALKFTWTVAEKGIINPKLHVIESSTRFSDLKSVIGRREVYMSTRTAASSSTSKVTLPTQ